jgi:hypothetical protein
MGGSAPEVGVGGGGHRRFGRHIVLIRINRCIKDIHELRVDKKTARYVDTKS